MTRKIFFLILILFLGFSTVFSQRKIRKNYQKAETLMEQLKYKQALTVYKQLVKEDSTNANFNFKTGFLYFMIPGKQDSSLIFLKRASKNISTRFTNDFECRTAPIEVLFYLGQVYHINYEFDKAIKSFNKLKTYVKKKSEIKEINYFIEASKNGKKMVNSPKDLFSVELNEHINSEFDEHSPVVSGDVKTLIFTSKRKGTGEKKDESGDYYEDIYISKFKNGEWTKAKRISENINTKYHEASVGLSIDGKTLYIYRGTNEGDIYYSNFVNNEWTVPKSLGDNINTEFQENHASISADGRTLYFTSNRKGGHGGTDIYYSKKTPSGKWGKAVNLGKTINTPEDEEGPFIHFNDSSLYFSSKGHDGLGGFDLFFSEKQRDGEWSKPKNLGFPINTTDDDIFYVESPDGDYAFYVSNKSGKLGDKNIYMLGIPAEYKKNTGVISGKVHLPDSVVEKYGNSQIKISILDEIIQDTIRIYNSDINNGWFIFSIPKNKNLVMSYDAPGQLPFVEEINIKNKDGNRLIKQVKLEPANPKTTNISYKINYDNSDSLNYFSQVILKKTVETLKKDSNLIVQICTPNSVKADSKKIKSITNFFAKNKIPKSRVKHLKRNINQTVLLIAGTNLYEQINKTRLFVFNDSITEINPDSKSSWNEFISFYNKNKELYINVNLPAKDSSDLDINYTNRIFKYLIHNDIDSTRILYNFTAEEIAENNVKLNILPDSSGFDLLLKITNKNYNKTKPEIVVEEKYVNPFEVLFMQKRMSYSKLNFNFGKEYAEKTGKIDSVIYNLNMLTYILLNENNIFIEVPVFLNDGKNINTERERYIFDYFTTNKVDTSKILLGISENPEKNKNIVNLKYINKKGINLFEIFNDYNPEDLITKYNILKTQESGSFLTLNFDFDSEYSEKTGGIDSVTYNLKRLSYFLKKNKKAFVSVPVLINDTANLSNERVHFIMNYFKNNKIDTSHILARPLKFPESPFYNIMKFRLSDNNDNALSLSGVIEKMDKNMSYDEIAGKLKIKDECAFLKNNQDLPFKILYYKNDEYTFANLGILDSIANCLIANPEIKIELSGYVNYETIGEEKNNINTKRINFTRDNLLMKGVNLEQIICNYKTEIYENEEEQENSSGRIEFKAIKN